MYEFIYRRCNWLLLSYYILSPTNKDEANSNDISQEVASVWLIILPVALPKKADRWIQPILAQTLQDRPDKRSVVSMAIPFKYFALYLLLFLSNTLNRGSMLSPERL